MSSNAVQPREAIPKGAANATRATVFTKAAAPIIPSQQWSAGQKTVGNSRADLANKL